MKFRRWEHMLFGSLILLSLAVAAAIAYSSLFIILSIMGG